MRTGKQSRWAVMPFLRPILLALVVLLAAGQPGKAGPALLFEPETGRVLHAYQPFQRWHPASLTKLMTLYVVFEDMRNGGTAPATPVVMSDRSDAVRANTMGWPVGAEIRLEETIPILITKSANDIAVAVAETISGNVESFVTRMNETAARLGMTDTRFVNPHGLHDAGQYTTARDMAVLVTALMREFPEHLPAFSVAETDVRGEPLKSHNQLLGRFPGADGIKTGYVCSAGWNIAGSATREGRRLVAIVLGALREGEREEIAGKLLEAGFGDALDGTARLSDLERPAQTPDPVDMRPYSCGDATPPLHIASFGLDSVPVPRPRPVN